MGDLPFDSNCTLYLNGTDFNLLKTPFSLLSKIDSNYYFLDITPLIFKGALQY